MVGIFLLDMAVMANVQLLPYYFLLVVISAGFVTPRQMRPLIVEAYVLAIIVGLHWSYFSAPDYGVRLAGFGLITVVAVHLSAERCKLVQQLRSSEQIFSLAIDNAAAVMGLADASGRLFRVNPLLCTMLGRDAASHLPGDVVV